MAAKIKIDFDVFPYVRAHGRHPRGRGYWVFTGEGLTLHSIGTYGEAKRDVGRQLLGLAPQDFTGTVTLQVEG